MSKQVQVFLIPTAGAKPEFLAVLEPSDRDGIDEWDDLPSKINLEGYTRDSWAWKPHFTWKSQLCKSVDGKNKLKGFVGYLKERQKSAYGRYSPSACLVITYIQKDHTEINVKFTNDLALIPNCPLARKLEPSPPKPKPIMEQQQQQSLPPKPSSAPSSSAPKKSGLLGNLLGAQQRTNHHLHVVPAKKISTNTRTAAVALSEFRTKMEQTMLDFDISSEVELEIPLTLSQIHAGLPQEAKERITVEILTFMVYEQAEEVNEAWIAHKEPGEFMDDVTIKVYKEGHAPDDVLEEINKVELTEDMRGQQMALQQARQKQTQREEKQVEAMQKEKLKLHEDEEDFSALNTRKRDRRTIEEIQRDMVGGDMGEAPASKR
jgi:hypothetical protein